MNNDLIGGAICTIVATILIFLGIAIGAGSCNDKWRAETVEKGLAEYVVDGKTAVWQWKDIDEHEK